MWCESPVACVARVCLGVCLGVCDMHLERDEREAVAIRRYFRLLERRFSSKIKT